MIYVQVLDSTKLKLTTMIRPVKGGLADLGRGTTGQVR